MEVQAQAGKIAGVRAGKIVEELADKTVAVVVHKLQIVAQSDNHMTKHQLKIHRKLAAVVLEAKLNR